MLDIEYVELEKLKECALPENPRAHDIPALIDSIRRFGFVDPEILNARVRQIAGGNGRLEALAEMKRNGEGAPDNILVKNGKWLVPVVSVDVPEEDHEALTLALNAIGEGKYKMDLLVAAVERVRARGKGLEGTGIDLKRLQRKLQACEETKGIEKEKSEGNDKPPEDPWVTLQYRVPRDAALVVEQQIERVCELLGYSEGREGLALERMAILCATTEDDEIEGVER